MRDAPRTTTLASAPGRASGGLGFIEDYQRSFVEKMGYELKL